MHFESLLLLDWKTVAAVSAALTAIITLGNIFWVKAILPVLELLKHTYRCVLRVEGYMALLDEMAKEFKPNGGNSLKDVLNRLESNSATLGMKMHAVSEHLAMPSWEANSAGQITWMSSKLIELLELPVDSDTAINWIEGISYDDRQHVANVWKQAVLEGRDFYDVFRIGTKNPKRVISRGYAIKNSKGTLMGFTGTIEVTNASE